MKKIFFSLCAIVISLSMLCLMKLPVLCQDEETVQGNQLVEMTNVAYQQVDDQTTQIMIDYTGSVKYHCFKISKPERLVIEMSNTALSWKEKEITISDSPSMKRIRAGQFQTEPIKIVRVVIDLLQPISFEANESSQQIIVTIRPGQELNTPPAQSSDNQQVPALTPQATKKNIEDEEHIKKVSEIRQQIKKPAQNATKAKLPYRTASIPATSKTESDEKGFLSISKQIVSLDFFEADIREVLRVLSMQSGVNIIYGQDVKGSVTIHLSKVPFDEGLKMILKLSGLVAQQESDNVLRIVTPEYLINERGKAATFTRVFNLDYAQTGEVSNQLKTIRLGGIDPLIAESPQTNGIIVTTTPEGLDEIAKMIQKLDVKPKQVLIQAQIIELTADDALHYGVDWQIAKNISGITPGTDPAVPLDADLITTGGTQGRTATSDVYEGYDITQPAVAGIQNGGTGVSLPSASSAGQLFLGSVISKTRFNFIMSALASTGKHKILSSPKVVTLNNKEASILSGEQIPIKETKIDSAGLRTETIKYVDVGIKLIVKPTINYSNYITLTVNPQVSSAKFIDANTAVISIRQTQSSVLVKDGDTLVIGGLIKEDENIGTTKVPLFGDIPIIGYFFKSKSNTKSRTELIAFITPTIIEE